MKAVFGYGSLVDVKSASTTLGREVLPLYVKLYGHRRMFNATWDGYDNNNGKNRSVLKPSPTCRSRIASTYYDVCTVAHEATPELSNDWAELTKRIQIPIIQTDLNRDQY